MTETLLIEIDEETAGLLVRDGEGYRFHSSGPWFDRHDARVFATAREARRVLREHLASVKPRVRRAA